MNRALIASFGFCVLFGLQVVLQSTFLKSAVHPMHFLFFVYLSCFLILTVVNLLVNRSVYALRIPKPAFSWFIVQTLLWNIADITVFLGLMRSSSVNYSIISRLQLFITYLGAVLFLRESVTGQKVMAIVIAFLGSLIIVLRGQELVFNAGDLLFFVSAAAISVSGLLRQKVSRHIPSLTMTYWMFGVATVVLGIVATLAAPFAVFPNPVHVLIISVLAIGGFAMVNYAISKGGASQFTLVASLLPFATALFAYLVQGEAPSVNQLAGGILILVSILLFVVKPNGLKRID